MNTERILRRRDVEIMTGLSRSTIYAAINRGAFPAPIKIGRRAVGWPISHIESWLNNCINKDIRNDK